MYIFTVIKNNHNQPFFCWTNPFFWSYSSLGQYVLCRCKQYITTFCSHLLSTRCFSHDMCVTMPKPLCCCITVSHCVAVSHRYIQTTLFLVQGRNLATEPSLWPGQSCGTVYRQQFVTLTVTLFQVQTQIVFNLCFNDWLCNAFQVRSCAWRA